MAGTEVLSRPNPINQNKYFRIITVYFLLHILAPHLAPKTDTTCLIFSGESQTSPEGGDVRSSSTDSQHYNITDLRFSTSIMHTHWTEKEGASMFLFILSLLDHTISIPGSILCERFPCVM